MKLRKLLTLVLSLVFVASAAMLLLRQYDYTKGAQDQSDAMQAAGLTQQPSTSQSTAGQSQQEQQPTDEPDTQPEAETISPAQQLAQTDLAALQQTNPDVTGWIWIPGTSISYPVVRTDDNDYYLTHNWKKERSSLGSIFLDYRTAAADFNTLIYGHRMRNGSMFAELKYYNTIEKWNTSPDIYLLDDTGVHCWRIFAAYEAETDAPIYKPGELTQAQRTAVINYAMTKTWIDTGVVPTAQDRILTLVTCTGDGYDARWVVQAVLQPEE